jgi:hypothetical protein
LEALPRSSDFHEPVQDPMAEGESKEKLAR